MAAAHATGKATPEIVCDAPDPDAAPPSGTTSRSRRVTDGETVIHLAARTCLALERVIERPDSPPAPGRRRRRSGLHPRHGRCRRRHRHAGARGAARGRNRDEAKARLRGAEGVAGRDGARRAPRCRAERVQALFSHRSFEQPARIHSGQCHAGGSLDLRLNKTPRASSVWTPRCPGRRRALASGVAVTTIEAGTLGQGWLAVSRAVLERGAAASWGGLEMREVAGLTLAVERPDTDDPVIARAGRSGVAGLDARQLLRPQGRAPSSAARAATPRGCSTTAAAAATSWPGWSSGCAPTDVPRRDDHDVRAALRHVVHPVRRACSTSGGRRRARPRGLRARARLRQTTHGNLVELAHLQEHVATRWVSRRAAPLHVKTTHVYATEWELMTGLSGAAAIAR